MPAAEATKAKDLLGCSSCNESEGIFVGDVSEPETMKAVMTGHRLRVAV